MHNVSGRSRLSCWSQTLAIVSALSMPGVALAGTKEVALASRDAALTYCQSGKMPASDIDYIVGADAFAQYGPGANCTQQAADVDRFKKAMRTIGKGVVGCKLVDAKAAVAFCQSGGMGTHDVAYIGGKVDSVISGPADGCATGFGEGLVSYALCK